MGGKIGLRGSATTTSGIKATSGFLSRFAHLAHKSLAITLSALLFLQPAIAQAQSVSAAGLAPAANRPGVGAAPNGVPLIDIVTPNGAGLSHNKYDNFNVGTPGLILNNFNGEVGTSSLGGVTPGNPNLSHSNPAAVILNEVTSGNRSALNGPTEVFGGRADVVIANQNGITCNGCGFINTPRATLTTGVPDIGSDGRLTGFTVNGGDVTFEGAGGNFASAPGAIDLFDVVSRNIHVNAPVYGKTVRLTGGADKYDYAAGEATALAATSGTPEYAIDGSALGAMQADRIKVVVTEKGAGVRMSGSMAANAGELSLSADGKISIGNASGRDGVAIASKQKVTAAKVTSKQKIAVRADQGITLQSVAADGDVVLASGGLLSVVEEVNGGAAVQMTSGAGIAAGKVTAAGAAALTATSGDIAISDGIVAGGGLEARATGAISADLIQSGGNLGLNAGGDIAISGNMVAQGGVTATGRSISAGTVASGVNLAETQAGGATVLASAADISLTASGGIDVASLLSSGNIWIDAADLSSGGMTAYGAIGVDAATDISGQILAGSDVVLSGESIKAALIASGIDFAATAAADDQIVFGAAGELAINATGAVDVGRLLAAGNLDIHAGDAAIDAVTGYGGIVLAADNGLAVSGQVLGAGNVDLSGRTVAASQVITGVDFAASTASSSGAIAFRPSGDLTVTAGSADLGTLTVAGVLNATTDSFAAGAITGYADVSIAGATAIGGQLLASRNVAITGSSIQAGAIAAGVAATAQSPDGGIVLSKAGDLKLDAEAGDINVGNLLAAGKLIANASGNIGNTTAVNAVSHQTLAMTAGGAIHLAGQTMSAGNLDLSARAIAADTLVSGVDFAATAASPDGNLMLHKAGAMTVKAGNGGIAASALISGGDLAASATQSIAYGSLQSLGNAALAASGGIGFTSTTRVAGNLTLTVPGAIDLSGNRAAAIVAGGSLTVNAASANLARGNLVFGGLALNLSGTADLTSASLRAVTNAGGTGNIAISASGLVSNAATNVLAAHDLTLSLPSFSNAGQFAAQNDLAFRIAGGLTNSSTGLIYAGHDANLFIGGVLTNDQGAILAEHDLSVGGSASGSASAALVNKAGLIQAGNGMVIHAGSVVNSPTSVPAIERGVLISSEIDHAYDALEASKQCTNRCSGAGQHENPTFEWVTEATSLVTRSVYEDQLIGTMGAGAKIVAGGNLTITANDLTNSYSAIEAGAAMTLNVAGTLTNEGTTLNRTTEVVCDDAVPCQYYPDIVYDSSSDDGSSETDNPNGTRDPSKDINPGTTVVGVEALRVLSGSITAGGALTVNAAAVNNIAGGQSIAGRVQVSAPASQSDPLKALDGLTAGALFSVNAALASVAANDGAKAGGIAGLAQLSHIDGAQLAAAAKPQSGGVGGTIPGQVFLFETRAAFLDVSKFYGSAYFIDRVGYTPETKVPFLGDAYFDNQLIDEQMRQLVGSGLGAGSFVPGDNAVDQMKALLDNGVAYAKANGLALGQALTPEQAAALTQSMVIYQTEVVDGAQVLVPVVYLSAEDRSKTTSAATVAGKTVSMDVASVDNSGAIAAVDGMTINATSIKANGGAFLAGGNMNLNADNGIVLAAQTMNIGGQTVVTASGGVTAGGGLKLDAGTGGLTLTGSKVAAGGAAELSGQTVTLGAANQQNGGVQTLAGTKVEAGGSLAISGTDGINVIASTASAGGDMSLVSVNGAVDIVSAGTQNTTFDNAQPGKSLAGTTTSLTQQGSALGAGGSLTVSAGQGILLAGSSLDAGGNVGLVSRNGDIAITASQDRSVSKTRTSSSTTLANNGSSITSKNGGVTVEADNGGIGIIGSEIAAEGGAAKLIAKGDITIGEATDSASFSGQSGSKKTSETMTAARGSSISGQTGVGIASTGGNVTISASSVEAGDATHTADATIKAAGNVVIASGKNTDETTSDSKSRGFLSSKKTHTHSYDEYTVASLLAGTGNVTVDAGGEAVVSGSKVNAGGELALSGSTVTVMGAEETHESDKQVKKSGLFVGSGGGFLSIYGSKNSKNARNETDNIGSALTSGGDVSVTARAGDLNIMGSSVDAGRDINLSAARDVNVTPGAESSSQSEQEKRSGFGIAFSAGGGGVSIGIGAQSTKDSKAEQSDTNAISALSAGRDLNIAAGNNVNLQAAGASAERDVNLFAGNDINLLSASDVTNYQEAHEKTFAGVTLSVSSQMGKAASSIMNSAERLSDGGGVNAVTNTAIAGLGFYQGLKDLQGVYDQYQNSGKIGFDVSLTIGASHQQSQSASSVSSPAVTDIRAGRSISMEAENGSITSDGAQILAGYDRNGLPTVSGGPLTGDIFLSAANGNINLNAATGTAGSTSSNSSWSAGIGVGASFGATGGDSLGLVANAGYGKGGSNTESLSHTNTHLTGTGDVVIDTNGLGLRGATVSGHSVSIDASSLTIESQVDTAHAHADQLNVSGQIGFGSASLSGAVQKANGDAALVSEQSGIHAGAGGVDIDISGKTSLVGGLITSDAAEGNNHFSTGTLETSDIDTHSTWKAETYGGSIGTNSSVLGAGLSLAPVKAGENETGKALSAIGGNIPITITDPAHQTQDIGTIRRDTDNTNTSLPGLPDLENILRDQYKTQADLQAAQATMAGLVGDIANSFRDRAATQAERDFWSEGGAGRALLHAIGGGLLGGVNDWEGALKGALGGASSALLAPAIKQLVAGILKDSTLSDQDRQTLATLIGSSLSALAGAAVGGGEGAGYAAAQYQYNYLTHEQLDKANKERAALQEKIEECKASLASGCSGARLALLEGNLEASTAYYRQLSDANNAALVSACAASFASAACVSGRQELRNAVDEEYGLQAHVLGTGPVNTPDALLLGVLDDVAAGHVAADQIGQAYQKDLATNQTVMGGVGALALLTAAGVTVGPEVYSYCAINMAACANALAEVLDCTVTVVCTSTGGGILSLGAATKVAGELEQSAGAAARAAGTRTIVASDGTTVVVPAGYRPIASGGALANDVGGLPTGYMRVVDERGNVVIAGPNGAIYDDVAAAQRAAVAVGAPNRAEQLIINRQNGTEFEKKVVDALDHVGGTKNTIPVTVTLQNGKSVTTIPDLWGTNVGGLLEAKNVQNLSLSTQLQAQIQVAIENGKPLNLIVSPRTQNISGPLINGVRGTGGNVYIYNPATDSVTPW